MKLSIDDYRLIFVVEVVYDLRVEDLLCYGICVVLVDLDNIFIVWNNLDGIVEVCVWLDEMIIVDILVVVVFNNNYVCVECVVLCFGVDFVSCVMKLFICGINMVIECYGFDCDEVIMVGD